MRDKTESEFKAVRVWSPREKDRLQKQKQKQQQHEKLWPFRETFIYNIIITINQWFLTILSKCIMVYLYGIQRYQELMQTESGFCWSRGCVLGDDRVPAGTEVVVCHLRNPYFSQVDNIRLYIDNWLDIRSSLEYEWISTTGDYGFPLLVVCRHCG